MTGAYVQRPWQRSRAKETDAGQGALLFFVNSKKIRDLENLLEIAVELCNRKVASIGQLTKLCQGVLVGDDRHVLALFNCVRHFVSHIYTHVANVV